MDHPMGEIFKVWRVRGFVGQKFCNHVLLTLGIEELVGRCGIMVGSSPVMVPFDPQK